jgi:putative endonuclease
MADVFYVYVLKNPKSAALYYGFSSNLKQRFEEHQKMPKHAGWKLVYYEAYLDEQDARDRERMLKQYGASRSHLKQRIARSLSTSAEELESAG